MAVTRKKNSRTVVIDWSDVKMQYLKCVQDGEYWSSQPVMAGKLSNLHKNPYKKDSWEGGSAADTLKWLREGYHAPEFANSAEYVPVGMKNRAVWNEEEGDVDPGRLLSGRDDFFLGAQKRLSKPGLRIQIEFAFAWTVSSKVIEQYGAWCAGFIGALESYGFDLTVDMWIPLDGLFQGDGRGYSETRSNILIRVKRINEVSDFTEWSALFSPTGYRQLGFTAKCVAGDKIGKKAASGLGMTLGGKTWGVHYDKEKALVMITCNQRGGDNFNKEVMNDAAIKAGLIPDRITGEFNKNAPDFDSDEFVEKMNDGNNYY